MSHVYRYFTKFQSKGYAQKWYMQPPHHTKAACFSLSLPPFFWMSGCRLHIWHIYMCAIPCVFLQYDWQSQCLLDSVFPPWESHLRLRIPEYGKSNGICILSPVHKKMKSLPFFLCLDVHLWNLANQAMRKFRPHGEINSCHFSPALAKFSEDSLQQLPAL